MIQSTELTYARSCFLASCYILINENNYRILFLDNDRFSKKFNIKRDTLLKKYPYDKYEENLEKGNLIYFDENNCKKYVKTLK